MTEYTKLIQELRIKAESFRRSGDLYAATRLVRAADAIQELVDIHQLDLSEIFNLRRQAEQAADFADSTRRQNDFLIGRL